MPPAKIVRIYQVYGMVKNNSKETYLCYGFGLGEDDAYEISVFHHAVKKISCRIPDKVD